jgi:hypothetical protein
LLKKLVSFKKLVLLKNILNIIDEFLKIFLTNHFFIESVNLQKIIN